jgi:hypothetical protein
VIVTRQDDLAALLADDVDNLGAIRCDDDAIGDTGFDDALPHANYQREAGEKAEGFSGETGRAQSGWDHSERLHASRSARVALTAAKFTS